MDDTLRNQFFIAIMRYKKMEAALSAICEMSVNELAILQIIAGKCRHCESTGINLDVPYIQEKLQISKPAVSYILNALEKKAYITRGIDASDRRKISIRATPEGITASEIYAQKYKDTWNKLLSEFGDDDTQQLVALLERLCDLFSGMNQSD